MNRLSPLTPAELSALARRERDVDWVAEARWALGKVAGMLESCYREEQHLYRLVGEQAARLVELEKALKVECPTCEQLCWEDELVQVDVFGAPACRACRYAEVTP